MDFAEETSRSIEVLDAALKAFNSFGIDNLGLHLNRIETERFAALFGFPPPNNGFFGPPIFGLGSGPGKQDYFDSAARAAAVRRPRRLPHVSGGEPALTPDAVRCLWDLGQLLVRGPLLVAPECREEPAVAAPLVSAATASDHHLFVRALTAALEREDDRYVTWQWVGAGRFVEDYLDPSLAGSAEHFRLVDRGLLFLAHSGEIPNNASLAVLSELEKIRAKQI